jgi:hypothetical protein
MTMIEFQAIVNRELSSVQQAHISRTIERLGRASMTKSSHGHQDNEVETVMSAAIRGVNNYTKYSKREPAIAIMDVILAANRAYNRQVKGHVERMRVEYPGTTIKQLSQMVLQAGSAANFARVWGHNDARKFETLKEVLRVVLFLSQTHGKPISDYMLMSKWAKRARLSAINEDDIGKIPNVGIATFQHLRMTFGVDTVKPDRQVKDVLRREFGLSLSDRNAILVVERFAEIHDVSPFLLDHVFVKFGSGHYAERSRSDKANVTTIVRNLKTLKVSVATIAEATGWSIEEVDSV